MQGVFFFVDFFDFYLLSLHWLIWTCLSVQSVIQLVVCPHSFISVGWQAVTGFICHPVVSAWGADALWPLYRAVWPSFLCMLWWSLSLICFFWKLHYPFFPYSRHNNDFCLTFQIDHEPIYPLAYCFLCLVAWKGNTAPFQQCGFALLILYCKWIWKVTVWLWPGVVLDRTGPNCGRDMWAEECDERDSGMVFLCLIYISSSHG